MVFLLPLHGAVPHFLLTAPLSQEAGFFSFLFFFRGKFHCAIFSGDNLASHINFILLPTLLVGTGGLSVEQPRDAGSGAGLWCAGGRGLPSPTTDPAPPAPCLAMSPWWRLAQPGHSP